MYRRAAPAVALARATGIALRGFHSNSSSSTASSTAAIGVANVADMPAAAPATSSVLRSAAVRWKSCEIDRPDRAARHDDRAFGAERPARSDRDRRRKRLQNRQPRLHFAAVDQDRFERFRNAVPANALGAVSRHEADDQAAGDGDQHREPAEMVSRRRNQHRAHAPVVEDVGEKPDQAQQRPCDERAQDADADRQQRNRNHARRGGEIAQLLRIVVACDCSLTPPFPAVAQHRIQRTAPVRGRSVPVRSRCASASLRRIARPAGVSRIQTSRLSSVPGRLAIAPAFSSRLTSSTALWC